MIEKFSVRKPFTVLVGVVLVIVLGVVSFMGTSTDLLPSMDLPFAAVFTTYIGATPEQVERDVSIPLEGRLSTLSGIANVQSISNEHVSIILLEFTGATNMDSAALELREALDSITLPEGTARPMTMRMNPDMMPIMTANVHMEGLEIAELSAFASDVVAPAIEGVPGVAVVNLSGLVQNQLHVVVRDEYVQAVNAQLAQAGQAMLDAMMGQMESMVVAHMNELMLEGVPMDVALEQATIEVTEMLGGMGIDAVNGEMPEIGIPAGMISVDAISGILFAQNFSMPAGLLVDGAAEYMVRVGDRFETLDEIKNMLIFDPSLMGLAGVEPIRLSDVAHVFETDDSHLTFTQVNGYDSVMFTLQAQSGFVTADVTSDVRDRMDALSVEHDGLVFTILMDQGEMIDVVVSSVLDNLLIGGILAIVVLFIFLRDVRPTLVVAISIPVSIMLAFTAMYFSGITLNMISMGGLALTVGMLVDNSIVVIENIYRMKADGKSAARAAVYGTKQVAGAIAAATLTTTAMFLPIVFTSGITRQIFGDLGLTIAYSLLASLIVAMTVVPAAASTMLRGVKKHTGGKFHEKMLDVYEKSLRWSLRFKWPVLLASIAAFALATWGILQQGMELFPDMDMPQVHVSAEMPEDATFEDAVEVARVFSALVLAMADVETVGVTVGGGGGFMAAMGGGGMFGGAVSTTINMDLLMSEDRTTTQWDMAAEIREIGESLGLEVQVEGADGGMGMMMGNAISLQVIGTELDDIRDTAIALAELVNSVEGTTNVTDFAEDANLELRIVVDRDAAMARGLTIAQVFMEAMNNLSPNEQTMNMTLSGRNYEIVITDGDFIEPTRADIENMQIATPAGYVALSEIATVHEDLGFTSISRINRSRFVTVSGGLEDGFNVALVNAEIEALLEEFVPAGDARIEVGGEMEMINDAMNDLILMIALGLLLTYLIMVAQFQSLMAPFVIMFTIPLAFTGGFVTLMLAGMPLSIVAMIGLILLSGVAINNGIVLVSRITQDRWEGMTKTEAIVDAGRKRLRPILMTAISTIFAMSVLAIGIGEGTEMMQPMAVATIGGLFYATITTLFVVPILYDMFHKNKDITKEDLDAPEEIV
ncbi:MAG: efflux RND transporter permease subunit [Defluviitaleaceae bacterium]|nr:efflux RND transporter permease subunit [Defluviitaleaceae bacterium]